MLVPPGERASGFPQVAGTPGQVGGRWKSPTWPLPRAGKGVPRAMPTPALPQGRAGQTRPHLSASTLAGSLYRHHSAITAVTCGPLARCQTAHTRWETGAAGGGGARTHRGPGRKQWAGLPARQSKGLVTYTRLAGAEGPTVCQVPAEGLVRHGFM